MPTPKVSKPVKTPKQPGGGLKGSKAASPRGTVPRFDSKRKAGIKAGSLRKFGV